MNVVAPAAVNQREFALQLAKQMNQPLLFRFPDGLLRFLMGEMSVLLRDDQLVLPDRLQPLGYAFRHPQLAAAIAECTLK